MKSTALRSLLGLAGFMLAAAAAAGFSGYFTARAVITETYAALLKPVWAPPAWVFGPVWTCLYICMSWAAWLVWKEWRNQSRQSDQSDQSCPARTALVVWWGQLAVNAAWPVVFYLQPAGLASALVCGALACLVLVCCGLFLRCSRWAAALLVPYVLWLGLATALAFALWRLNG